MPHGTHYNDRQGPQSCCAGRVLDRLRPILDNQIYRGVLGAASKSGHLTMEQDRTRCGCGNNGCLEQFASGPEILRSTLEEMTTQTSSTRAQTMAGAAGTQLTTLGVFELAQKGNESAVRVKDDTSSYLVNFMVNGILTEISRRCSPSTVSTVKIARVPSGTTRHFWAVHTFFPK